MWAQAELWGAARRVVVTALALALLTGTGACGGDATPPARGFGSRQLVQLRAGDMLPNGQLSNDLFLYQVRTSAGEPWSYFTLDVASGELHDYGSEYPSFSGSSDPGEGVFCI